MRLAWALALAGALLADSKKPADAKTPDFLSAYCVSCHGPSAQMANRRFDQLHLPPADAETSVLVQKIVDKLNVGAMPPAGAKQPPAAEKQRFVESLTHAAGTGNHTALRRLNRREYLNTIGDLLGINMLMFDPTTKFPRDQTVDHMDNIADALVTSGYLLEQY